MEPKVDDQNSNVPTHQVLNDLAKEITECWESLGTQLAVDQAKLECIRQDNVQMASPDRKAFEMLKVWREKDCSSTYRELENALKHEGKVLLAEKYCGAYKGK